MRTTAPTGTLLETRPTEREERALDKPVAEQKTVCAEIPETESRAPKRRPCDCGVDEEGFELDPDRLCELARDEARRARYCGSGRLY